MRVLSRLFFFLSLSSFFISCASEKPTIVSQKGLSFLSKEIRDEIRKVEKSIVGINTTIKYDVQKFNYLTRDGQLVPDPKSRLKYKLSLKNGDAGTVHEKDSKTLSGGGLIIDVDKSTSQYLILTSSHLVSPQDTTDIYFTDDEGNPTDVLFTRYIVKKTTISVRGTGNWRVQAQLLVHDPVDDLALLQVETDNFLGFEFRNPVGYNLNLSWGDWVFLFGYPKGVKQMTGGWVSKAPYRGTLAIDAVVRFGYSGGPVFAISENEAKLAFVGLIKSVPRSTLDYVSTDGTLPAGYHLDASDLDKLVVKKETMVDYGTAYFVAPNTIKKFIKRSQAPVTRMGFRLHNRYFGK